MSHPERNNLKAHTLEHYLAQHTLAYDKIRVVRSLIVEKEGEVENGKMWELKGIDEDETQRGSGKQRQVHRVIFSGLSCLVAACKCPK